jgi:DNA-binding GntR family transcriptional regulator
VHKKCGSWGETLITARTGKGRGDLDGAAIEQRLHETLSRALLEGRLTPGAKLPEHRLAALFHVSRERVRKVLHRLVAERRLEAVPQRGVFVPNPTVEEIGRTYLAHRVFEAGVIAELARRSNTAILDKLESHLEEERIAADRGDRAASVGLSGEFHLMLVDSLESPELSRFLRELLARSSLMVSAFEPVRLSLCGVDEHAAIAAALRAGDAERAIALSGEHFRHIEERLAQGLAERANVTIEQALAPVGQITARKTASRPSRNKRVPR